MKKVNALPALLSSVLCASAFAQPNLPDTANQTAHDKVMENVPPEILEEADRLKQAHQDRAKPASRNSQLSPQAQALGIEAAETPPAPIVIIAVETDDGEVVATEL